MVGHGGAYVKHIQYETGCRVQIKGRGSGFLEQATNRESDEDMFLHVTYVFLKPDGLSHPFPPFTVFINSGFSGREESMVEKGKELCEDLIDNVKQQYEEFKNRPPRGYGGGGGHRGSYGDHGGASRGDSYQPYGGNGYRSEGRSASPRAALGASPTAAATPASAADYAAQYAQYYGGQDPYAAYGGYAAFVSRTPLFDVRQ